MKELADYLKAEKAIFDYFDYKRGWVDYSILDCTDDWWYPDARTGEVFADNQKFEIDEEGEYENTPFSSVHSGYIIGETLYVGKDYTALVVDYNTDGNKYFAVYSNGKRLT